MTPRTVPPSRGGKLLALFVALVFLAVIGGSTGYVLGRRQVDLRDAAKHDAAGGSESGSGSGAGRGSTSTSAKRCLTETEELAKTKFGSPGGLVQVLYINTRSATTGSEVWICRDSAGRLFYQGHRKSADEAAGAPREALVDLVNALLLADPRSDGGNRYTATNSEGGNITRYIVTTTTLTIVTPSGTSSTETVLNAEV